MPVSNLSDFNSNSRQALIVARKRRYSDIDLTLKRHPLKNDIILLKDIDAVKNAVKNLVLTNFHERPFSPAIGGNIRALLFENADNFTIVTLKENIKNVLIRYEPRVTDVRVDILDNSNRNQYEVSITFRVRDTNEETNIEFKLKRYR